MWIKNTEGKPDAVLTMALIGFLVVVFRVLLAGVSLVWGDKSLALSDIDTGTIGAILTPTLGAYVARRYTDKYFETKLRAQKEGEDEPSV